MDKSNKPGRREGEEKSGPQTGRGSRDAEQKRRDDEKEPSGSGKNTPQSAEKAGGSGSSKESGSQSREGEKGRK